MRPLLIDFDSSWKEQPCSNSAHMEWSEASARIWQQRRPGWGPLLSRNCHIPDCRLSFVLTLMLSRVQNLARSNDAVEAQVEQLCKLCWASALEARMGVKHIYKMWGDHPA